MTTWMEILPGLFLCIPLLIGSNTWMRFFVNAIACIINLVIFVSDIQADIKFVIAFILTSFIVTLNQADTKENDDPGPFLESYGSPLTPPPIRRSARLANKERKNYVYE